MYRYSIHEVNSNYLNLLNSKTRKSYDNHLFNLIFDLSVELKIFYCEYGGLFKLEQYSHIEIIDVYSPILRLNTRIDYIIGNPKALENEMDILKEKKSCLKRTGLYYAISLLKCKVQRVK